VFDKNDEGKKQIRKRKAMRLNDSGIRRMWKAGFKNAIKQRNYGLLRKSNQTDHYFDDFDPLPDMEETGHDS